MTPKEKLVKMDKNWSIVIKPYSLTNYFGTKFYTYLDHDILCTSLVDGDQSNYIWEQLYAINEGWAEFNGY